MTTTHPGTVLRRLRDFATAEGARTAPDRQLLRRFAHGRDEAAFAALVRRHGPLVLGVCRRVLHHEQDAEDAFQATFLVLAQKAAGLDRRRPLGGWLYQVAYNMALNARKQAAARHRREARSARREEHDPLAEVSVRELLAVFDEELQALPEGERQALVLCYLESKTRDEAARAVGCSESTLKRRLERGKERMRRRLSRRGVALPAALLAAGLAQGARAAVPVGVATAAVRAGLLVVRGQAAAGVVSARAAALAAGAVRAMAVGRAKAVGAVLVTAALLGMGAVLLASSPPPAAQKSEPKAPAARPAAADDNKQMTVSGRVLDADGKPLAGARVAVCARQGVLINSWQGWASLRNDVLGRATSDKDGNYRLSVPRTDPLMTRRYVRVVATAPGHGLAWKALDPDAARAEADVRLTSVRRVSGHIGGLQGEDAAGVTLHVVKVTRKPEKGERADDEVLRPPGGLPASATTDAKGNFVLGGFGPGLKLELEIRDPRYERKDEWVIDTGDPKQCENIRLVLGAGRCAEGRVVYADTGLPVPHARLMFANPIVEAEADEQGRFKVALFGPRHGYDVGVYAYAPPGEPYVNTFQGIDFSRGVVHREVEVRLPRGVLLRGKVTEAGSGKPVAGAYVTHSGLRETYAVTGPDGGYRLGVPAGAGRLMVTHPSDEYIPQILGSAGGGIDNPAGGSFEKPAGDPSYYHALVAVDVKKDGDGKEVNITLRRGVTVKGRLVGPDDKPIAGAVMFVSAHKPRSENTMHPVLVRDGHFEVRGLDAEKTYRLLFLEHPNMPTLLMTTEAIQSFGQLWLRPLLGPQNKLGMSVEVSPTKVKDELTVRLASCGKAKVRFLDAAGKPLANYSPWLQLVVTPGPPINKALQDKVLAAEVITLTGRYGEQHSDLATDKEGYITFEGLIPGATYRLKKTHQEPNNEVLKDFTVEAGKTLEVTVPVK